MRRKGLGMPLINVKLIEDVRVLAPAESQPRARSSEPAAGVETAGR